MAQMVLTPGGYRPADLVHALPPGHGLHVEGEVVRLVDLATQQLRDLPVGPKVSVPFGARGPGRMDRAESLSPQSGSQAESAVPGIADGWEAYAWWDSGASTSITRLATSWVVPPAPLTSSAQTVFLFNGIQNTGSNFGILQPVLQWGSSAAGGGAFWSVASWYVTSAGQAFHTTPVKVQPGTKLVGVMTETGVSGSLHSYSSTFQGIAGTTLPVQNIALLHWANQTLECYGIKSCTDLPPALDTALTAIDLQTGAKHPALSWNAVNAITNCGQRAVVRSNANPGGEVDLWYHVLVAGPLDSVAVLPNGKIYVTFGPQYLRYSDTNASTVDADYPQPIAGHWGNLPAAFNNGFDAVTKLPNGKIYVTRGAQYIRYSDANASTVDPGYPKPLAGNWGNLPPTFQTGFDSMAVLPNGKIYVTRGGQYIRYSDNNASTIDAGYPKPIAGNWGNLPAAFQTGFDSMCMLPNGKIYVTRGTQYVRYSDANASTVDAGYPQPISGNWG